MKFHGDTMSGCLLGSFKIKAEFNLHLKFSFGIKWAQISPKLQISALLLMYTLVGVLRNYINQKIFSSSKNGHYWSYLIICLQSDHFRSQHRPILLEFFFSGNEYHIDLKHWVLLKFDVRRLCGLKKEHCFTKSQIFDIFEINWA